MDLSLENLKVNNKPLCLRVDTDAIKNMNAPVETEVPKQSHPILGQETVLEEKPRIVPKIKAPNKVYKNVRGISGFSGLSGFSGFSGFSGTCGFSGISGYQGVAPGSKRFGDIEAARPRPRPGRSLSW